MTKRECSIEIIKMIKEYESEKVTTAERLNIGIYLRMTRYAITLVDSTEATRLVDSADIMMRVYR